MRRAATLAVALALATTGCGDAPVRTTRTAAAPSPTYTAVVTDDRRATYDAQITRALEAMAAFGTVVSRVDGDNLKGLAPRFRSTERAFGRELAATAALPRPTVPALAVAHDGLIAAWTRLHRAMRAIATAARGDDARAFLTADDRFIAAAAAAQRAGDAFAKASAG